jgi:hypothetical protein
MTFVKKPKQSLLGHLESPNSGGLHPQKYGQSLIVERIHDSLTISIYIYISIVESYFFLRLNHHSTIDCPKNALIALEKSGYKQLEGTLPISLSN